MGIASSCIQRARILRRRAVCYAFVMSDFPAPLPEAMIYQDEKLYVCLASYPITRGHLVVVWNDPVRDLHTLPREDYEYLMDIVDIARDALLERYGVEKVYLLYLDEANHVHWHLVPRYDEKGFNVLTHSPQKAENFSDAEELKRLFDQNRHEFLSAR